MKFLIIATLASILFTATGCMKIQVPVAGGVTGQIVDQVTEEPLENIEVYFSDYPQVKAFSNNKGIFELPTQYEKRWVPILPIDFFPADLEITVVGGEGYETKVVPPYVYEEIVVELKKSNAPYRKN